MPWLIFCKKWETDLTFSCWYLNYLFFFTFIFLFLFIYLFIYLFFSFFFAASSLLLTIVTLNIGKPYHTCPKIWTSPFQYLLMCLDEWQMCGLWSDDMFCCILFESTLFAQAWQSQYFGGYYGNIPEIHVCSVATDKSGYHHYIFFLFLNKNIWCGYSLEVPASNEYSQHVFVEK